MSKLRITRPPQFRGWDMDWFEDRGIIHALMCCGNGLRDPVSRQSMQISTTTAWQESAAYGARTVYRTLNGSWPVLNVPLGMPRYNGIGSGDFSVAVLGTHISTADISPALSGAGGNNQWRLQANLLNTTTTASAFTFITYDNILGFLNAYSAAAFTTGELCMFVGVREGTSVRLYKNGIQLHSVTGTARNAFGSKTLGPGLGWSSGFTSFASGTQYISGGHRMYGYVADRAWTADEVAKMWREWRWGAFFVPKRTWFIPESVTPESVTYNNPLVMIL